MAISGCVGSDTGSVLHPFFARTGDRNKHLASVDPIDSNQASRPELPIEYLQQPRNTVEDEDSNANVSVEAQSVQATPPENVEPPSITTTNGNTRQWTLKRAFGIGPAYDMGDTQTAKATCASLDVQEQETRRKRRRTSQEESVAVGVGDAVERVQLSNAVEELATSHRPTPLVNALDGSADEGPARLVPSIATQAENTQTANSEAEVVDVNASKHESSHRTPPKKMLRLSATGKFSSPPIKTVKQDATTGTQEAPRKRGRPRKSKEAAPPPPPMHLLVRIPYQRETSEGQHSAMAQKINDILSGTLTIQRPQQVSKKKKRTPRKQMTTTHPFFNDKPKPIKLSKPVTPRRAAAVTPGKLRAQNKPDTQLETDDHIFESALLKDRHIMRHPGAQEPLWPSRDMVHVRALSTDELPYLPLTFQHRKLKSVQRRIPATDALLSNYAHRLQPEPDAVLRSDGFREPSSNLHVPQRLLISAADILAHVLPHVKTPLQAGPADELSNEPPSQHTIHPAIQTIHDSIPTYLSGYDQLQGETYGWAAKHAPTRASDVLQPTRATNVLKTWLRSLEVNAVDGALPETSSSQAKPGKKKRKRKQRAQDLDDFIVDEDDDDRSMVTISDDESTAIINSSLRSIVQSQVKGVKASNVILISGPHGCGKTAAVYAVAKELDYRVFEISSSEKRAGKDVLDKIGNVTENHMVKHHGVSDALVEPATTEDSDRIDAAFKKDLESGRQGKMSSFFQPKAAVKSSSSSLGSTTTATPKPKQMLLNTLQKAVKKPRKSQQQSLILLEEVDILFKDDKEFWNTVMRLILTSKRPVILTCNDEDLVPIQALNLHAILRFAAPIADLAIDYLLLVAAKEGHVLQRKPVACLWQSSGCDLRRALTTLDFWCRFGVGDIRDGLTWIYQRWPVGTDVNSSGQKIRVVSEGTFHAGLLDDALPSTDPRASHRHPADARSTLTAVDVFTSMLSDIDTYSRQHQLDQTLPDISEKRRLQYIDGMMLLDAKEAVHYSNLALALRHFAMDRADQLLLPSQASNMSSASWLSEISEPQLPRKAFAVFDGLANPVHSSSSPAVGLETSVFDRPLTPIVTDVAPYVRQVLRHDLMLEEQRSALAGPSQKARKTRAAMSALEGGQRQLTRRQWWWEGVGDLRPVLATAGETWAEVAALCQHEGALASSQSPESG